MKVERLQISDKDLAAEVMQLFFLEPDHGDYTQTYLANDLNYFLVAIWEGKPIGVLIGYELQRPETHQSKFFVYDMEVLEAQRGRGIGKALIEAFKDYCKQKNGSEIFLMTNRSNVAAMRLYTSTGGVQEGEDNVLFVYDNFDG